MQILEPVNVWVFFKESKIEPYLFFWKGRPIKISKVNLIHASRDGLQTFYHFSVSSDSNFYKLRFELPAMRWFLEAVEEG